MQSKPTSLPETYATVIDAVNACNRAYFRANPAERCCLRPYAPGGYPPAILAELLPDLRLRDSRVLAQQLAWGVRCRQPIGRIIGRPTNGRITLVAGGHVIAQDISVIGWEGA